MSFRIFSGILGTEIGILCSREFLGNMGGGGNTGYPACCEYRSRRKIMPCFLNNMWIIGGSGISNVLLWGTSSVIEPA